MASTPESGRKSAETLNPDPEKKSSAAQKTADTRKRENPEAFREMGEKGGKTGGSVSGSPSQGSKKEEGTK